MNANTILIKLAFVFSALGLGMSAGFASTQGLALQQAKPSTLIAYFQPRPGPRHTGGAHQGNSTEPTHAQQFVASSCLRVYHMPKPISVYRNRFCVSADNLEHQAGLHATAGLFF